MGIMVYSLLFVGNAGSISSTVCFKKTLSLQGEDALDLGEHHIRRKMVAVVALNDRSNTGERRCISKGFRTAFDMRL